MNIESNFKNIRSIILEKLYKSQKEICIAVGRFPNNQWYEK